MMINTTFRDKTLDVLRGLALAVAVLLIGSIEIMFLVFHFFCGALSIGFGLFGCTVEALLRKTKPDIYD